MVHIEFNLPEPTAEEVKSRLVKLKNKGAGLGNINETLSAITDALIYLVDKQK